MEKLLVVCGPTATGKTQLGVELAKKFNGEIISADSRQVYKGMDIGTGKDLQLFDRIPVWMLDVVNPTKQFSVAQYYSLAIKVIGGIRKRGKLAIVVGGTGLYIKALVDGIETINIPPDKKLRNELRSKTAEDLIKILRQINPKAIELLNESELKNKQRLIRRIEIARWKLKMGSENMVRHLVEEMEGEKDVLMIGIAAPREVLYERIDQRVDKRMEQGMVQEVKDLLNAGVRHERLQAMGLEYRAIDNYILGKIPEDVLVNQLKYDIHTFARRQLTWFKKDKRIHWFDVNENDWQEKVEAMVQKWYNRI